MKVQAGGLVMVGWGRGQQVVGVGADRKIKL